MAPKSTPAKRTHASKASNPNALPRDDNVSPRNSGKDAEMPVAASAASSAPSGAPYVKRKSFFFLFFFFTIDASMRRKQQNQHIFFLRV
jgi:hypothetical protein